MPLIKVLRRKNIITVKPGILVGRATPMIHSAKKLNRKFTRKSVKEEPVKLFLTRGTKHCGVARSSLFANFFFPWLWSSKHTFGETKGNPNIMMKKKPFYSYSRASFLNLPKKKTIRFFIIWNKKESDRKINSRLYLCFAQCKTVKKKDRLHHHNYILIVSKPF